jgi:uncharacterized protein YciI
MFIVFLRFSENKQQANALMAGHKQWLASGFADGVFLLAGSLKPHLGGAIVAHHTTREELGARIRADPFVAHDVVTVELLEITPAKADPRLAFLLA